MTYEAMTRNGSLTAHSREWPLYEREEDGTLVLFMLDKDRVEKERLDADLIELCWD